jgi:hypothetical protein
LKLTPPPWESCISRGGGTPDGNRRVLPQFSRQNMNLGIHFAVTTMMPSAWHDVGNWQGGEDARFIARPEAIDRISDIGNLG